MGMPVEHCSPATRGGGLPGRCREGEPLGAPGCRNPVLLRLGRELRGQ